MNNKLFCLIGVSGVGKTTVRKYIVDEFPNISFLPSYTTRAPRQDEVSGIDYFFTSIPEFEKLINEEKLIEWEKHFDHYYGISKQYFYDQFDLGNSLIKEIAFDGYHQILEEINDREKIYSIFIQPESNEDVINRLFKREFTDIDKRIQSFNEELNTKDLCDSVVISKHGRIDVLCEDVRSIITRVLK